MRARAREDRPGVLVRTAREDRPDGARRDLAAGGASSSSSFLDEDA